MEAVNNRGDGIRGFVEISVPFSVNLKTILSKLFYKKFMFQDPTSSDANSDHQKSVFYFYSTLSLSLLPPIIRKQIIQGPLVEKTVTWVWGWGLAERAKAHETFTWLCSYILKLSWAAHCGCHWLLPTDQVGLNLDHHKQFQFFICLSSTILKAPICFKLLHFWVICYVAIDN